MREGTTLFLNRNTKPPNKLGARVEGSGTCLCRGVTTTPNEELVVYGNIGVLGKTVERYFSALG
jgi:hypothetical protein